MQRRIYFKWSYAADINIKHSNVRSLIAQKKSISQRDQKIIIFMDCFCCILYEIRHLIKPIGYYKWTYSYKILHEWELTILVQIKEKNPKSKNL